MQERTAAHKDSTLEDVLATLRNEAQALSRSGVLHTWVIGSVARREDGPGSDIDIVGEFARGSGTMRLLDAQEHLASVFGRRVDLSSLGGLDRERHAEIFRDMVQAF